ncbi:hypothetical protein WMY93_014274 [Mugilogobius chulae]|uniref:Ig-like domain-containing protein n=1 Tax=Mugilogobius chulae TaxID=88201 RepID=A0AAW0P643_9GOBI
MKGIGLTLLTLLHAGFPLVSQTNASPPETGAKQRSTGGVVEVYQNEYLNEESAVSYYAKVNLLIRRERREMTPTSETTSVEAPRSTISTEYKMFGHDPVVADVHTNATLPCHVEPEVDLTKESVVWSVQLKHKDTDKTVHLYRKGEENTEQDPDYKHRTEIHKEALKKGNISVTIHNVSEDDNGTYTCQVVISGKESHSFVILEEYKVFGHDPVVADVHSNATLPCHVEPEVDLTKESVVWSVQLKQKDTDKTVHLYRKGEENTEQDPDYKHRTEIHKEALKKGNISVTIHNVSEDDNGTYTCQVVISGKKSHSFVILEVRSKSETRGVEDVVCPVCSPAHPPIVRNLISDLGLVLGFS